MKALFTHKSIRAVFLWYREACPQEQGHLGELDPGREGFPACSCCLLSVPRMCTGLWEPPLEMVLTWADTLHSDMLTPLFFAFIKRTIFSLFVSQRQVLCTHLLWTDGRLMVYDFQGIYNLDDDFVQKNVFYDVILNFWGRNE